MVEVLPAYSAMPSWQEGFDAKPALQQPKQQQRKAKSKHARKESANSVEEQTSVSGHSCANGDQGAASGVSVISALQEFVQDSKSFRMPSRHSILQWHFEERCVNTMAMQFRATAAFVLDGVPHQVAGDWQSSKNLAKRDAAERSLGLFVGMWGCQILQEDQTSQSDPAPDTCISSLGQKCKGNEQTDVDTLVNFCRTLPACCQCLPKFSAHWDDAECKGLAEISFFNVPHTFAGSACSDESAAISDVAQRVLWYLQCPGFLDSFDVDMDALAAHSQEIATPPSCWTVDGEK
jgi:hypothetical protein